MTVARSANESSTNWETSLLRATAFYTTQFDLGAVKWWENLTGRPAESRVHRAGIGQLIEVGAVESKLLQLQIQPGRIDWVLAPKDEPDSDKFSSLGGFAKSSQYFGELIFKWLDQAPPLNRVAFGAVLTIPTQSDSESVRTISRFLPNIDLDWENVRDFMFQVNRPRPCVTIPQLDVLNRLVKWQSVLRKMVVATIGPQIPAPVTTAEQWAAQCELDISTGAPSDPSIMLPPEQLKSLFAELMQHGNDVASKGSAL
jgi:hypothetical protein